MSTAHFEAIQAMNLIATNWPSLVSGDDANRITGYWNNDAVNPKAVTPSTDADPLLVLLVTQVISLLNHAEEFDYNQTLTPTTKKALWTSLTAHLVSIIALLQTVEAAYAAYTATLP